MDRQKTDQVLQFLNALLDPNLSLHSVSFIFDNISEILRREDLTIKIINSKHFYLDPELHFIYLKKIQAFANRDFDEAAEYSYREITLLNEKGENEKTILRTFPEVSFFEYDKDCIVGHLSKGKLNERLVINLIESYHLLYIKK
jgi:hypothetical protein